LKVENKKTEKRHCEGIPEAIQNKKKIKVLKNKEMKTQQILRSLTAIAIAAVLFAACDKDKKSQKVLNLTAINDSKSQLVNVKLKSMEKKTFSIGCHVGGSTIFDAKNKIFGYMACDDTYRVIDIETGTEIKRIALPDAISMVVVDTIRNVIIGQYYINGENKYDGTDQVLTINLNDGSIVSDKQFYVGGMWDASTYFFRDIENEYVLLRSDEVLVFINPSTGSIIRTLKLNTEVGNGIYDRKNNRLIGTNYSNEIVTIDINTGKILSKVTAQGLSSYDAFERDYDAETNSYILVSANNEVLFFDVATGKVNERHQLDFDVTSLKVWRSEK